VLDELYTVDDSSTGYDKLNRLTDFQRGELSDSDSDGNKEVATQERSQAWSLDALGNWSSLNNDNAGAVSRTHNKQNQLTNDGTNSITYDNNGSMKQIGSGGSAVAYSYDAWNRLVGQTTGATSVAAHTYDALGRRTSETPTNTSAKRDLYYSTRWQVLEERDSAGTPQVQQVWSPFYVDELVERDSRTDGALDTSFDSDGKVIGSFLPSDPSSMNAGRRVRTQVVSGSEKILIAGRFYYNDGIADYYKGAVARYSANGSLDTTFGSSGIASVGDDDEYYIFSSISVLSDGKILAAGVKMLTSTGDGDFVVCRFTSSGSLDSTFGTAGEATIDFSSYDEAYGLAVDSNGKIYITGNTSGSGPAIASLNSDGTLNTGFDSDGKKTFTFGGSDENGYGIAVQSDNKVVVTGQVGTSDVGVARFNTDGSYDTGFDSDGKIITDLGATESSTGVTVDAAGKLLVVGSKGTDVLLLRYTSSGSLDSTFGSSGVVTVNLGTSTDAGYEAAIATDGKIVVAGATNIDVAVLRFLNDGSLDPSFGTGGSVTTDFGGGADTGISLALQSDGKILITGWRDTWQVVIARYLAGPSLPVRQYVQQDANYNVTSISSSAGSVVERYKYDPYGTPTIMNPSFGTIGSSAYNWQYLHQGGRYDSGTGLYHFRNRDLRAADGRWLQVDPLHYIDSSNLYSYIGHNPGKNLDPSGAALSTACRELLSQIQKKMEAFLDDRQRYDSVLDGMGGWPKSGGGTTTPGGHYKELLERKQGIENDIKKFMRDCFDPNDPECTPGILRGLKLIEKGIHKPIDPPYYGPKAQFPDPPTEIPDGHVEDDPILDIITGLLSGGSGLLRGLISGGAKEVTKDVAIEGTKGVIAKIGADESLKKVAAVAGAATIAGATPDSAQGSGPTTRPAAGGSSCDACVTPDLP